MIVKMILLLLENLENLTSVNWQISYLKICLSSITLVMYGIARFNAI